MPFSIKVKSQSAEFTATVHPEMTIQQLKVQIAEKVAGGVTPEQIRLLCLGRVMADDKTIAHYNIEPDHVVHLLVKNPTQQPPSSSSSVPSSVPLPRSDSTDASAIPAVDLAEALPPGIGAALGGIDVGGVMRGLFQTIGAAAANMNAQRNVNLAQVPPTAPSGAATPTPHQSGNPPAPGVAQPNVTVLPPGVLPPGVMLPGMMPPFLPPQPSPLAAVHVHLHVTLAELDAVPEQVQRLQQRLAANQPTTTVTQIHIQTHPNGPISAAHASAHAAHNPNPGTARPPAPAAPAAPRNLAAVPISNELEGTSLVTVLHKAFSNDVGVNEAMQLMQGHWAIAERVRSLAPYSVERTGGNSLLRDELVEEAATDAMAKLEANNDFRREINDRVRPGVAALPIVFGVLRIFFRRVLLLALETPRSEPFGPIFRRAMVKLVGQSVSYFERKLARNGPADVEAILHVIINASMTEVLRARPDIAPFAGMAAPMIVGTLREWRREYETSLKEDGDDFLIEQAAAVSLPVSTRQAVHAPPRQPAPPAEASRSGAIGHAVESAIDDLLDECLGEVGAGAPAPAVPPTAVQRALEGVANLTPERRRELGALSQQDREAPANLAAPPAHYFAPATASNQGGLFE